jgi:hypothetical protein
VAALSNIICGRVRSENSVVEVEDLPAITVEPSSGSLCHQDFIVDKYVGVGDGFGVGMVGRALEPEGVRGRADSAEGGRLVGG